MRAWVATALILPLLAAGCVSVDSDPLTTTPQEAVLIVLVTEEHEGGRALERIPLFVCLQKGTGCGKEVAKGVTDLEGIARLRVNTYDPLLVQANAEGWTEEAQEVRIENGTLEGRVVLPLFHTSRQTLWNLTWGGPVDPQHSKYTGMGTTAWKPRSSLFSNDSVIEKDYMKRITKLDLRVAWSNTLTSYADLGAGASRSQPAPESFQDAVRSQPNSGPQEERLTIVAYDLIKMGLRAPKPMWVGPGTGAPLVSLDGVPVRMTLVAEFSASPDEAFRPIPGLEAGLALVGVVAAILLARRRDRTP